MSDVPFCSSENACTEGGEQTNGCEPVCINVSRIYDSCGAKDCLSNLPVMFTEANQKIIDGACSVKISNVRIITSTVEVEPVAFHRGFYSVDMMYYFAVTVEAYTAAGAIPETVTGLAMYGKRVVLYGGDGCVKSFSSDKDVVCDTSDSDCPCKYPYCLPRATVQISNPMALSANLQDYNNAIPETVTGLAMYGKRVVLYGGDGCVKSFSSDKDVVCDTSDSDCPCKYPYCLPRATVQISNPMALSANLQDYNNANPITVCRTFPNCVIDYLDGEPAQPETQRVLVTIGIFTITRLERDVQIMIPSYDFCVPRKECPSAPDDPCEVFSKIDFPTDSFFPPNAIHRGDRDSSHTSSFKCGCEN